MKNLSDEEKRKKYCPTRKRKESEYEKQMKEWNKN